METSNGWPKELAIHYWRLEENFKSAIKTYISNNILDKQDDLKRFIAGLEKLAETNNVIMKNSECLFLVAHAFFLKGKFDKVYQICEKDPLHPGLINLKIQALINQRKFNDIENLFEKAFKLSKQLDPYNSFFVQTNKLLYLYYSDKIGEILFEFEKYKNSYYEVCEKFASKDYLLDALTGLFVLGQSIIINLKRREGNLEEGIKIGRELIPLIRKTENRFVLNRILNNTALCLIESGNMKEGLLYLEESFKYSQALANDYQLSIAANNIGFIYRNMGNLENAMKYFYIALDNAKKADVIPSIVASETNIAHLHLDFGNPNLALSSSETAVESIKKSKVPISPQIKIPLDLCRADIFETLDRLKESAETLEQALKDIEQAGLDKEVTKIYIRKARLAVRVSNIGEASRLLEEALTIAMENNLFEIIVNAKLQLAEIDLLQYRISGNQNLLLSALIKIEDYNQLCEEQNFKLILIDGYILQGLLLSLNNKQKQSKKVLEKAIALSNELNLTEKELEARNQLKEIEKEKKNILVKIFTRINQSIRSSITFESAIKPKKIEEELKALFIISKKSGLPIYQNEFIEKRIDSSLLSGLLSAIQAMSQTILDADEGGLRLIAHGNVSIMLENIAECFIALVVSKETFFLRLKLREFSDRLLNEAFFKAIDHSVIKTSQFRDEKIDELVDEYLLKKEK